MTLALTKQVITSLHRVSKFENTGKVNRSRMQKENDRSDNDQNETEPKDQK